MNILIGIVMLIGYLLSPTDTCTPIWSFENHRYCDGIGTYTLYLCTDEQGQFTEWMNTCSSAAEEPVFQNTELVFLPIMVKGE